MQVTSGLLCTQETSGMKLKRHVKGNNMDKQNKNYRSIASKIKSSKRLSLKKVTKIFIFSHTIKNLLNSYVINTLNAKKRCDD